VRGDYRWRRRRKAAAMGLAGGGPLCFYLDANGAGCGGVLTMDVDPSGHASGRGGGRESGDGRERKVGLVGMDPLLPAKTTLIVGQISKARTTLLSGRREYNAGWMITTKMWPCVDAKFQPQIPLCKKKILITSKCRHMHRVLNIDEIKN
jgi:hypothetical protein